MGRIQVYPTHLHSYLQRQQIPPLQPPQSMLFHLRHLVKSTRVYLTSSPISHTDVVAIPSLRPRVFFHHCAHLSWRGAGDRCNLFGGSMASLLSFVANAVVSWEDCHRHHHLPYCRLLLLPAYVARRHFFCVCSDGRERRITIGLITSIRIPSLCLNCKSNQLFSGFQSLAKRVHEL